MNKDQKNGYGVIEILIASTLAVILFLSINGFLNFTLKMAIDDMYRVEALNLAEAQLEEARAVRDEDQSSPTIDPKLGWTTINALTFDAPYHFAPSGAGPYKWVSAAGSLAVGKFTKWFTVSAVQRANVGKGDIVSVGGTVDPETIKITSHVTWASSQGAQEIVLFEYLTNIK